MVRDVDRLDPVPDLKLKELDLEYLKKHKIEALLGDLLQNVVKNGPPNPVQYMIDYLQYDAASAQQDPATGLSEHRRVRLLEVFQAIDSQRTGKISLRMLQTYANKYGGETLTIEDLHQLFKDFQPAGDNMIGRQEFFAFFARVSRTMSNPDFEEMVREMIK